MHLIILLIVGLGSAFVFARVLATPGSTFRDEVSLPWALIAGLGVGVFASLVFFSTQVDLIPDDIEAGVLPIVIIAVTVTFAAGAIYRTLRP